jgi:hypothetical protein
VGDLNLEKRCSVECLDSEVLEGWLKRYDDALQTCHTVECPEKRASTDKAGKRTFNLEHMFPVRQSSVCSALSQNSQDCCNASSAVVSGVSDGGEETGPGTEISHNRPKSEMGSREVMLRTASKSLLKSKLLLKHETKEHVQQSNSDVSVERARILSSISPVHMTPENLIRSLTLFGLARRNTGVRIYEYLLESCPRGQSKSGDGLSFEGYFQLMRSLLGSSFKSSNPLGKPKSSKDGAHSRPNPLEQAMPVDKVAWAASDLLLRLMFSLLSGQSGCRAEHAAARHVADELSVPLSVAALADSLRHFLSPPVLLAVDRGFKGLGGDRNSAERNSEEQLQLEEEMASSSSSASNANIQLAKRSVEESSFARQQSERRPSLTQFELFVEGLHAQLMKSQTDFTHVPGECGYTVAPSVMCFRGFEHWVFKHPNMYSALMQLLLPLLPYGVNGTSEEMELAARGLSQRCGELRANMEAKAHGLQRKQMAQLCFHYSQQSSV